MTTQANLKIAVQLYGHLRTFETCAPSLHEYLLKHYHCDVFIHTWDQLDNKDGIKQPVDTSVRDKIQSLYQPKALKIDNQDVVNQKDYSDSQKTSRLNLTTTHSMLYSHYQANKLRETYQAEHHINYDYVVVIRPDILLHCLLNFSHFKREFAFFPRTSIHFIHKSKIDIVEDKVVRYRHLGDCYYFSTPDIISDIENLYNEFEHFFIAINATFKTSIPTRECAFFESLYQKNIMPRQFRSYYTLKRNNPNDDVALLPPDPEAARKRRKAKPLQRLKTRLRRFFKK